MKKSEEIKTEAKAVGSIESVNRFPASGLRPSCRIVEEVKCISFNPNARCVHPVPNPID